MQLQQPPTSPKANSSTLSSSTLVVAIVDDAMLARSMVSKYLVRDLHISSPTSVGMPADLINRSLPVAPDCLIISMRKLNSQDVQLLQQFASKYMDCWAIIVAHPGTETKPLEQSFAGRCHVFGCEANARASELAQRTVSEFKSCHSKFKVSDVLDNTLLPSSHPASASAYADESVAQNAAKLGARQPAEQSGSRPELQPHHLRPLNSSPSARTSSKASLSSPGNSQKESRRSASGLPTRLVVIGGSTGAPAAVTKLLQQLPKDFPVPIAVSLHMLEDFTGRLAQSLDRATKLRCTEARDNELLQPATVYIARGDHHLTVEKNNQGRFISRLNREPPEHFARPSVNQLFRSAAIAAGPGTLAVILTGIGSDGIEGCETLVRRGGVIIAQDEASSTVWGMPAAVVNAGLAKEVMNPGEAGQFIAMKIAVESRRQSS